ncbi:hypothetical protein JL102_21840 [Fulvivirga sp. 2943]|uniref:Uncharacterized protein n=2 Tax=Fulvivirga sediminis TaxID=2803949 RepID=A0A937FBV2_9BACT|nr:hypothetical protein [Fulvivirga sediminis]
MGFSVNSYDYREAIDPIDNGYTPLAKDHLFSFLTFHFLSLFALVKVWKKGKNQPPLLLVVYLAFLMIGIIINLLLIMQLFGHENDLAGNSGISGFFMAMAPALHVLISFILILHVIKEEAHEADKRSFKNRFLNQLNNRLKGSKMLPVWSLLALFPILFMVTILLILLGQEYDSLTKVFTETATWNFSQETHPPYLDHTGHYLCTVAACGSPEVVRPLRLGMRHGTEIIVNRQLLIANAFEDLIQTKYPRVHKVIRGKYDKYGYPLSKDINTKFKSNCTYLIMKPLEWLFLIYIYLNSQKPEKLIRKQYKMKF